MTEMFFMHLTTNKNVTAKYNHKRNTNNLPVESLMLIKSKFTKITLTSVVHLEDGLSDVRFDEHDNSPTLLL